jgi:phosphatidylglycerol---prolipoprotein diacylglyceryl transferase
MPSISDPIAISLGPLDIRWYAVFIVTGIILAVLLSSWLTRRRGEDPDVILDMAPWVVLGAIAGARLYYVILEWDRFMDDPLWALDFRSGGLTIHGAIIAGSMIVWLYCRSIRNTPWFWMDMIVPGVALGQAIGRWGNWANQEAFGTPTDLPWAVTIDPARRPAGYEQFATFHPTFLYESIFNVLFAVALAWVVLKAPTFSWYRNGLATGMYLIGYGLVRIPLESIRTDSLFIGPWPAAYWLSFGLIAAGVTIIVWRSSMGRADVSASAEGHWA